MGKWGSHAFSKNDYATLANMLSPKAKQAVLAAISKVGTLRKGTWNGCVFNAAGQIEGHNIRSSSLAAELFDMSTGAVSSFISRWDSMHENDIRATQRLKEALLNDNEALTGKSKDVVVVVHESDQTKLEREFNEMVAQLDIPMDQRSAEQQEFADSVSNAAELLFA